MLTWIAENGQVDLGNLVVGLGTLAVAAVSFYVASTANAYERNRVFVSYAGLWIEEMRKAVSAYLATLEAIADAATPAKRQALLAKLREQDIYIRLKFDKSDPDAKSLFPLLDQVWASLNALPNTDPDRGTEPPISSAAPIVDLIREISERKWRMHTDALSAGRWRWRRP